MDKCHNKIVYMKFGSHLYGTNTPSSDQDFKGVFLADIRDIILGREAKHQLIKSNKSDEKNTKEDTDVELKELRTFLDEAMAGQTYALDMLFAPKSAILESSPIWDKIVENRSRLLSSNLKPFIGYCRAQAMKYGLKGERLAIVEDMLKLLKPLQANANPTIGEALANGLELPVSNFVRVLPEETYPNGGKVTYLQILERKYDFKQKLSDVVNSLQELYDKAGDRAHKAKEAGGTDFKALSHSYRIVYELEELMETGQITFPLKHLERIRDVKLGKVPYEEINQELPVLIERITNMKSTVLPNKPDREFWDNFVLEIYGYGDNSITKLWKRFKGFLRV